ncbi:MAG: hypothetical protein CL607_22565 [Anaerolineaceae bacterium]|nr:hypothetical protein [Anaerolineaceae bacterium]
MSEAENKIANLDDESPRPVSGAAMADDELYAVGLDILKKGPDKQKFLRTFSQRTGKSKMQLHDLAERIWEENRATRRTNAIIVIGFGAVLMIVSLLLLTQTEITPILAGLPLPFGLFFAGQGVFGLWHMRRE